MKHDTGTGIDHPIQNEISATLTMVNRKLDGLFGNTFRQKNSFHASRRFIQTSSAKLRENYVNTLMADAGPDESAVMIMDVIHDLAALQRSLADWRRNCHSELHAAIIMHHIQPSRSTLADTIPTLTTEEQKQADLMVRNITRDDGTISLEDWQRLMAKALATEETWGTLVVNELVKYRRVGPEFILHVPAPIVATEGTMRRLEEESLPRK